MQKEFYTIEEVATILGFKVRTIRQWCKDGKIKSVKMFYSVRIPVEEVERIKKGC